MPSFSQTSLTAVNVSFVMTASMTAVITAHEIFANKEYSLDFSALKITSCHASIVCAQYTPPTPTRRVASAVCIGLS